MARGVHAPACCGVWGEEIRPIGEYREEEAIVNPMTQKGCNTRPGEDRRFTKEKTACAGESRCLKWLLVVRARVTQYPSHLTRLTEWKSCFSSWMRVVEGGSSGWVSASA